MRTLISKVFSYVSFFLFTTVFGQITVQTYKIDKVNYIHKKISLPSNNEVNYLEVGPKEDINKHDVFIFIQGSNITPLISEDDNGKFLLIPFSIERYIDNNKFVIVGKPHIPVYAHFESLTDDFVISDPSTVGKYFQSNTLRDLASGINELIKIYHRNNKVRDIYIIGHSQGARVAAAVNDKYVRKIAMLSVNLFGRFHEEVSRKRFDNITKGLSQDMEPIYDEYQTLQKQQFKSLPNTKVSSLVSYKSFTWPSTISFVKKLKAPTLIVYGGNDIGVAFSNDLARFEIEDHLKNNIIFKSYNDLDHNFKRNTSAVNDDYWQNVIDDCITWLKK